MTPATLQDVLSRMTREGELYEKLPGNRVRCFSCGHRCVILDGLPGICKVRANEGGVLKVPWGYVGALQVDPVEKKPFFHALPGSLALSFGMLGCDYHCAYCQNWITSQTIRDEEAVAEAMPVTPRELVRMAVRHGAPVVASTYNEPLITSEWAVAVFREAREAGLRTAYISNGNGTSEVLDYLQPWVDLYKVDLKGFRDPTYRKMGGLLKTVQETIASLVERKFWVEIVTLVVPGMNDGDEELRDLARFLVSVSRDMPWHVTAFHPDYKMQDRDRTTEKILLRAAAIGRAEGLRYVYAGNLPGQVGDLENTRCHACSALLIRRWGYEIRANRIAGGRCPDCGTEIPGVWS